MIVETVQQMQMQTIGEYSKKIFNQPYITKILLMPKTATMTNMEQIETIKSVICKVFGVRFDEINNTSRKEEFIKPRHAIIYFIHKHTDCTLKYIGKLFESKSGNGLDHSTIINASNTYCDLMTQNGYKARHKAITEQLVKEL